MCEGIVYKKVKFNTVEVNSEDDCWKIWLPEELTNEVIKKSHESNTSHGRFVKSLFNIREFFYWPSMAKQIKQFVQDCDTCKEVKHPKQTTRPFMRKQVITYRPFQKIYVDFLGPYPRNVYIFIVLDHQTKFVLLRAMTKATTKYVNKFGVPEAIYSDNGKQFTSESFKDLLNKCGITHIKSAVYAPQANASERVNQSILSSIRKYLLTDQSKWDENLSRIECSLRNTVHSSIGTSPHFALFGYNMVTHAQAYEILRKLGGCN